jgi:hypothetical protein
VLHAVVLDPFPYEDVDNLVALAGAARRAARTNPLVALREE